MPKMKPLKEWICDTCGEPVGIEDGWVEWISSRRDGEGPHSFHIVHNRASCYHHTKAYGRADLHLDYFLGVQGLQVFLSMLDVGELLDPHAESMPIPPEIRSFVDTIRRLQIPYYEEARLYFAAARDDGYFSDQNEVSVFLPDTCRAIIERYE